MSVSNGSPAGSEMPRTLPAFAPTSQSPVEHNPANSKTEERDHSKIDCELRAVIEDVMPHLVGHYRANFREACIA